MKLSITIDGTILATGILDANRSAADFARLLPITLNLKDYEAIEKIADLPSALTTTDAPDSYTPSEGDICFYAPWGNVAFFYKNGLPSEGLVRLGRFDCGFEQFKWYCSRSSNLEVILNCASDDLLSALLHNSSARSLPARDLGRLRR